MIRNIFIFLATFAVGALIAFGARAALHKPDATVTDHTAKEHGAMVSNPLMPASSVSTSGAESKAPGTTSTTKSTAAARGSDHQGHAATAATPTAAATEAVNSVCAICGMKVDPSLPTMEYQGKNIGFGCKMCAPKFKADPDKYGPAYLKNEVIKR